MASNKVSSHVKTLCDTKVGLVPMGPVIKLFLALNFDLTHSERLLRSNVGSQSGSSDRLLNRLYQYNSCHIMSKFCLFERVISHKLRPTLKFCSSLWRIGKGLVKVFRRSTSSIFNEGFSATRRKESSEFYQPNLVSCTRFCIDNFLRTS